MTVSVLKQDPKHIKGSYVYVFMQPDKGDYPENSPVAFCPNKQRSSEAFYVLATTVSFIIQSEQSDKRGITMQRGTTKNDNGIVDINYSTAVAP